MNQIYLHKLNSLSTGSSVSSSQSSTGDQRLTLVFFLGGVTYAEIAALRFLAQMDDGMTCLVCFLLSWMVLHVLLFFFCFFFKNFLFGLFMGIG